MRYKVIRIMHRLSISGPTHHAANLTHYLNKDKYSTQLLSGVITDNEVDGKFIIDALNIEPVYIKTMKRSINPFQDIKALYEIYRILRKEKPHIVHTHAAKSGALGRIAAVFSGVPIIIHTFHGNNFQGYFNKFISSLFINFERIIAKKTTKIIVISNLQFKEIYEKFKIAPKDKFEIIPLGFDLTKFYTDQEIKRKRFIERWKVNDEVINIGIIGRLTKIKNIPMFINSIFELNKITHQKIKAFVVGDGEEKQNLINQCIELGLTYSTHDNIQRDSQIVFTSWQENMDEVINGLDIIALTSNNEGTPVTLIEAIAAKKLVVSTKVGGVEDIIKHNENGYLTEINDVDTFAKYLKDLCENKDSQIKFTTNNDEFIKKYSYNRLVNDIENLYDKLIIEKKL